MKRILILFGAFFLVIVCLFILWKIFAGVSVPHELNCANDIRALSTQLEVYYEVNNHFPTTEQGLQALVSKPTIEPIPKHWEQYLDSIPTDSWGRRYQYRYPGLHNPQGFDLFSLGKNPEDPSDDIGTWNLESFLK